MPAVIPLIVAGVGAASSAYAAHKASSAAKDAATLQTTAATKAAEIQGASSDKALDFQKEQAKADQARYEAAQRATYNQYLTHYNAVRGLGASMGFDIPDAPDYDSAIGGKSGGSTTSASDPAVAFIRKYQSENPATSSPADLVKAAKAAGVAIEPYMYGQTPSNNEVTVNGQKFKIRGNEDSANPTWYYGGNDSAGGGGMAPTTGQYLPSSVASYLPQSAPGVGFVQTPELQRPQDFRLRGVASYLGGRS